MSEPGAAPASGPLDEARDEATPAGQNPLAERLSRVRDASKSRPQRTGKPILPPGRGAAKDAPPQRKGRLSGLTAAPFPGAADAPLAMTTMPATGFGGRLGGFLGRGRADAAAAPAPARDGDSGARTSPAPVRLTALGAALREPSADADATRAAGDDIPPGPAGGRQPHRRPSGTQAGGRRRRSFRTGLILTIVLLILLAAIAVWSALFLPDSPVARLLGGGSDVALDDPLDAPDAPLAITAPPAIGELASVDAPPALPETGPECAPKPRPRRRPRRAWTTPPRG
jgi:hypothetical protein